MGDLLASMATAAATHAIARLRQPQTLRGRVQAVGVAVTTVRLLSATSDVAVYNGKGASAGDHVLVEFRPDGTARIVEVLG